MTWSNFTSTLALASVLLWVPSTSEAAAQDAVEEPPGVAYEALITQALEELAAQRFGEARALFGSAHKLPAQ